MRERWTASGSREAALNMTGREINELRAIAAEVARCVRVDDTSGRFDALSQFYEYFRRAGGNPHAGACGWHFANAHQQRAHRPLESWRS